MPRVAMRIKSVTPSNEKLKEMFPESYLVTKNSDRFAMVKTKEMKLKTVGDHLEVEWTKKDIWILTEAGDFLEHQCAFPSKTEALKWAKKHSVYDLYHCIGAKKP